jgi:hypothetical protein
MAWRFSVSQPSRYASRLTRNQKIPSTDQFRSGCRRLEICRILLQTVSETGCVGVRTNEARDYRPNSGTHFKSLNRNITIIYKSLPNEESRFLETYRAEQTIEP